MTDDEYFTRPRDLDFMLNLADLAADAVIWDPFRGTSNSTNYFISKGYLVFDSMGVDFFTFAAPPPGVTHIITNPPFSAKRRFLLHTATWNLRITMILPTHAIQRDYFLKAVEDGGAYKHWLVVLPSKSLRFERNGRVAYTPYFKSCFVQCYPSQVYTHPVCPGHVQNVEVVYARYPLSAAAAGDARLLAHQQPGYRVAIGEVDTNVPISS